MKYLVGKLCLLLVLATMFVSAQETVKNTPFGLVDANDVVSGGHFNGLEFEAVGEPFNFKTQRVVKYQQTFNGIPVATSQFVSVNNGQTIIGRVAPVSGATGEFTLSPVQALDGMSKNFRMFDLAGMNVVQEKVYYPFNDAEQGAYMVAPAYKFDISNGFDFRYVFFVDASTGKILNHYNNIHNGTGTGVLGDSKTIDTTQSGGTYRMVTADGKAQTYSANNGTSLPGTLKTDSDDVWNDPAAVDAHAYAAGVVDYYQTKFGRNSFDGNGATVRSTVHYSNNYVNAFWNGSQMVYGDGDGSTALALSGGLDVVAHEITHALTQYTSDLVYQYESGALNEAFSDILGTHAEYYLQPSKFDWALGEDIWTPGTSGDALRYMNNPTADGQSSDHYNDRYTGSQDNGGVHLNSGIANLAFYLASEGGNHPRSSQFPGPTVTGIGIEQAAQIFFTAFTQYLSSNSQFIDARNACMTVAATYGESAERAIADAWAAVGVGQPYDGGGTGNPGGTELENGVPVSSLTASKNQQLTFTIDVPSGATNFSVSTSGGSGDADLYVKFGSAPTTSSYDFRSWNSNNNESVSDATPNAGTYHIMINAYAAFSGLTVVASYDTSTPNQAPNASFSESINGLSVSFSDNSSDSDGSIASRSWNFGDGQSSTSANPSHTYAASGTYTVTLTVTDNDGATDSTSKSISVSGGSTGSGDLNNGDSVAVSGSQGQSKHFTISVPAGATNLSISMAGGSGDGDLYVKLGSQPTRSSYDYRSWNSGNNESVSVAAPSAGTYHIMVYAYSTFSGATLSVSYDAPGGGGGGTTTGSVDGTLAGRQSQYYNVTVSGGVIDMSCVFTSGRDIDLYLYSPSGSQVASSTSLSNPEDLVYDTNGVSGTYQIRVYNYSSSSTTYTLTVEYQP